MTAIKLNDLALQWEAIKEECLPKINKFLESGYYIGNPIIAEFEENFAEYIGTEFAVAVSNGTDALKLSLQSLELTGKTCVLMPANTYIANAFAASYFNYEIKLIDCDQYYGIKISHLHAWLAGNREKYDNVIVMGVHLYGYPVNIERLKSLCVLYKVYLIEDCSQAHGAMVRVGKVGNFGELSVFSCYAAKNLGAAGECGVITTNHSDLKDILLKLRNMGEEQKYIHTRIGWNNRPQAFQCIILNEKLKYLDEWNSYRSRIAERYNKLLKNLPIMLPKEPDWAVISVFHLYVIRTNKRNELQSFLSKKEIETGIHYPVPISKAPAYDHSNPEYHYADYFSVSTPTPNQNNAASHYSSLQNLINTHKWQNQLLSLPMHPFLTDNEVDYVASSIEEFFNEK